MIVLGIETSCDETAVSLVKDGATVLSSSVASQIARHAEFGGVIPELAAREHLSAINPVMSKALELSGCSLNDIDAVAVTNGPGLMPALLVGLSFAKGLAVSLGVPLIGINHFLAHIYGTFLDSDPSILFKHENYPMLALVVSGGHTALVLVGQDGNAQVVGTTIDDAAGEAFDKAAKLLNIGYPGGPVIEKTAQKGDAAKFDFPRSLTGRSGKSLDEKNRFNFSFSGLKTSLLYHCERLGGGEKLEGQLLYDTAASFQEAIVDVLRMKTLDAARFFGVSSVILCGGVACNNPLRERLEATVKAPLRLFISPKKYCTDNAAMVAGLAFYYIKAGQVDNLSVDAYARLPEISRVPFCIS
ncbi:MAG: tRNA (adenosine(37)-N6)-threonylcarbamoyltransferase complex transferase subunit TsaD [Lentisphaerae bacterium GWF2_45_14]|nr:MAG: tRNA (adenosine(37)-N6)-threonylcarbamoyltransferase complex transferase subunit TsaD [Lentisphaerae bacterium GWF2_45_14]